MKAPIAVLPLALAACATVPQPAAAPPASVADVVEPAANAANPMVGGAFLPVGATIAANLAAAPTLSTFARLLTASGSTVPAGATIFAPTDEAFGRLAPGTVDALLKPDNRAALAKLVGLHIVAERLSSAMLIRRIAAGHGRATLTGVAGEPLTLSLTGSVMTLTDGGGNKSYVEVADVRERDGVIHVVNGVLVPRL